jgi:hypothetical protein
MLLLRSTLAGVLALGLLSAPGLAADDAAPTQNELIERDLEYRLDRLESQSRPSQPPRTSDLLTESQLGASQQQLRTLKTRDPQAEGVPTLERQLDRIQRGRAPRNPLLRN